jgi:hypothetical protein
VSAPSKAAAADVIEEGGERSVQARLEHKTEQT